MHITEGIITGPTAAGYTAAGLALMAVGAHKMKAFVEEHPEKKPLLGMAGAFIFFVSLIPIPAFTGTCSHPCGSPLAGIILGPWIGAALTGLSLLLQAAFFAHGGFSTWGANLITLGVGGAMVGWAVYRVCRSMGLSIWWSAALAGLIGDVVTYLFAGLSLGWVLSTAPSPQYSFAGYLAVIYSAYLPTQGPIAIGEMIVTGFALHYVYRQRPEVLESLKVIKPAAVIALALVSVAMFASPASTDEPASFTGMDEAVNEKIAEQAGAPPRDPYINTERGDLWNLLLLGAGGACGFYIGRHWDQLFRGGEGARGRGGA